MLPTWFTHAQHFISSRGYHGCLTVKFPWWQRSPWTKTPKNIQRYVKDTNWLYCIFWWLDNTGRWLPQVITQLWFPIGIRTLLLLGSSREGILPGDVPRSDRDLLWEGGMAERGGAVFQWFSMNQICLTRRWLNGLPHTCLYLYIGRFSKMLVRNF